MHKEANFSWSFVWIIESNCPGDGKCSFKGICDDTTGICICEAGFEGLMCQGKGWFLSHNCHIHSKVTKFTVIFN